MPYKDRGKWRGVVKIHGKRHTAAQPRWTKKDATRWEIEKRAELEKALSGTSWFTLIVRYLDHAKIQFTSKAYHEKRKVVDDFSLYLKRTLELEDLSSLLVYEITADLIQSYLMEQAELRSNNSANRDRKNLMAMWGFGRRIFKLAENPVPDIPKFRHSRKAQYVPPESDLLKILAVANARERAFLDCYLCTGARRSEIFNLTWENVNFEHRTITLHHHKTGDGSQKTLVLPMNQRLYDSLKWIWNNRRSKESPYVWTVESGVYAGRKYTYRHKFLSGLVTRAGVRAFGFHSLRRYVATYLSDKEKVGTKTIQKILGHSSEVTTERYLYNAHSDLINVMELLTDPEPKTRKEDDDAVF